MRVCLVYGDYPPKPPGTSDGGADFVAALAEQFLSRGMTVSVIVSKRDDRLVAYVTSKGVRVLPLIQDWTLGGALRGQARALREALAVENPDVVHLVYPDPYLRYGSDSYHLPFLLRVLGARRLVVTFFGFAVTQASLITKIGLLALFTTANLIVITDAALYQRFRRTFPFWAGKSRHGFVGSIAGRTTAKWSATELDRRRAKLGLNGKERLIGFFGFWSPDKGLENLIDAIARLRLAGEYVKLVLIGGRDFALRTEYEQAIQALIVSRGLENAVIQTGPLPSEAVADYLLAIDVCVLPFHVNPLGRSSLATALGLGVPLVVSRPTVGGDLLQGVVLVDPIQPGRLADAIREILVDPDKQARVSEAAARASANNWSWTSIADAYIREYRLLIGTPRDQHR